MNFLFLSYHGTPNESLVWDGEDHAAPQLSVRYHMEHITQIIIAIIGGIVSLLSIFIAHRLNKSKVKIATGEGDEVRPEVMTLAFELIGANAPSFPLFSVVSRSLIRSVILTAVIAGLGAITFCFYMISEIPQHNNPGIIFLLIAYFKLYWGLIIYFIIVFLIPSWFWVFSSIDNRIINDLRTLGMSRKELTVLLDSLQKMGFPLSLRKKFIKRLI